ncbi:MAG: hypothetical protein M0P64_03195 [Candidatus Pacebacteria bacterium]|jgi:hypothetical protein|nr:hypothetical protein [Candidatus Paceibacterota bacterium]
MLKIKIIANNIAGSELTFNNEECRTIANLPEKLRARVINEVAQLSEKGVSEVEYKEKHFLLSRKDQNYAIDPCPSFMNDVFLSSFIETIQLLYWYLGPHLRARDPGLLGGSIICSECSLTQRRGNHFSTYCEFTGCSSHEKWAQVIEGYEPPKYLIDETLAKAVQQVHSNNQTAPTIAPTADEQNKWAQKG